MNPNLAGGTHVANHLSTLQDFDLLAREVVRIGRELVGQYTK
jgi:hypothetical protein